MPPPELQLDLQFGAFAGAARHRALLSRARVRRWVGRALLRPGELAVRIVGEDEGRALNRQYRGKDYATNVLTFDYGDEAGAGLLPATASKEEGANTPGLHRHGTVMADLVLCGPVVEREAREQGKSLEDHYAHLLVHGTLHALGYDHETGERDALEMEALEILLLGTLGYANPY